MKWPYPLTLRKNLIFITLITTGLALLLATAVMFWAALTSFHQNIIRDITIKADIAGEQCTAALMFNSPRDAEETLRALRADPHIEYAAVYARSGALFALYRLLSREGPLPPASPPPEGHLFGFNHLVLTKPVLLHGERIGTITIRSDLRNLYALLVRYASAALVVLTASLLIAYVLADKLQKVVTGPVSGLLTLMEDVARNKDFRVRAKGAGPEELVSLGKGFNEMLATIEDRDRELARQRGDLEDTVKNLKRSSNELREANKKLKTLDKLKSDFVSTVSHEFRTPLTSIKAFAELLLMKPGMQPDRKLKLLRTIDEESDRLGRLINDLLDLSRIEAGTMQWRFEALALDDIIRTSVAAVLPLARNKGQRLTWSGRNSLPRVRGDRDRLVQVVNNILSNAVKFTPEGGSIRVEAREEPGPRPQIIMEVIDSGIGIPPEDIELIFDKFHRSGDALTSGIEGTGLGLSISRQIVEHHGGSIRARNNEDGGSTFVLSLPTQNNAG